MAVRGDINSSVVDFESEVVNRVQQDDPLGLAEARDLGIQRFRPDLSWTKEHVVRNPWQEKDVVQPVDHMGAKEEAGDPPLVLLDVAFPGAVKRAPGREQHERNEKMRFDANAIPYG